MKKSYKDIYMKLGDSPKKEAVIDEFGERVVDTWVLQGYRRYISRKVKLETQDKTKALLNKRIKEMTKKELDALKQRIYEKMQHRNHG